MIASAEEASLTWPRMTGEIQQSKEITHVHLLRRAKGKDWHEDLEINWIESLNLELCLTMGDV
jgi:hypothetical protein